MLERPKDPAKWPAYVFYFKTVLVLLNIVPFAIFLVLYARVLDRYASNDWAWFFSLLAAALGTYLLPFTQTLNNHTIAAFSAFFALYLFLRIWDEGKLSGWRFAGVGSVRGVHGGQRDSRAGLRRAWSRGSCWSGIPGRRCSGWFPRSWCRSRRPWRRSMRPWAKSKLVYTEFGTESYLWEGSLWKTPLELDALNLPWFDAQEAARRGIAANPMASISST